MTANMLSLSLEECAQLVGEAKWASSPAVSGDAALRPGLVGVIGIALTELEVSAAATAAAQQTAKEAMELIKAARAAGTQPDRRAKAAKLDDAAAPVGPAALPAAGGPIA